MRRCLPVMVLRALFAATAAFVTPARAQMDYSAMEGAWRRSFPNQDGNGRRITSENILEIVRVTDDTAYIRIRLQFANGHQCNSWGIARAEEDQLVYRRPAQPGQPGCVLQVRMRAGGMTLTDVGGHCQATDCGARGSYDGEAFPLESRRRITYLDRLRAGQEYRDALAEFPRSPRR